MLERVEVQEKSLGDYRDIVGDSLITDILDLAGKLDGARVVHINATAFGGGVAEMLQSLIPLMCDVGLAAEWHVIDGEEEFFNVTKAFHNGLQGMELPLTDDMKEVWQRYNRRNALAFGGEYDFVVVHDPQPAGLRHFRGDRSGEHWIWRSHIDTSHPNIAYWEFMVPFLLPYQAGIFSMSQYMGEGLGFPELAIIHPSIDPLWPKNRPMDLEQAEQIVHDLGVDLSRPLISQISRYDPWKDPLGVIDVYRIVKDSLPEVQLVLMASMASDDPEGWEYLDRTKEHAGDDPDIHLLHFERNNDLEVNAFQTRSDVVVQKSVREGFGLVVTEALWKGRAVVGGAVGGIPLQIIDGETGFLVQSIEECAEKVIYLLQHREEAKEMGARAKEHVRQNFLTPRHLRDYLELFRTLSI
ncbi:MAG: glycosyltransferase [Anaerolineae bacterium]